MNKIFFTKPAFVPFFPPATVSVLAISVKCVAIAALAFGARCAFKQAYQQISYYKTIEAITKTHRLLDEFKTRFHSQKRMQLLKGIGLGVVGVAAIAAAIAIAVLLPTP